MSPRSFSVGHQQRAGFHQVDPVGNLEQAFGRDRDLFLQAAIADTAHHAIAHGKIADPFADRFDRARDLATGRERARRLELVHVANDQRIGKVDRTGSDLDQNLTRASLRGINLLDNEGLRATGLLR